ncbi:hypothetical protein NST28_29060 [Paenibacillus sp. FSL R10-2791]|uniref:hypothetical protein n=1 Tax=Paenibacillus sp. FSL R10-2791 TaxID=2954695 RepID=UPI0030F7F43E
MALSKKITLEYDSGVSLPVESAYIVITSILIDKNIVTLYVSSYVSRQHYHDGKASLEATKTLVFQHDISDTASNTTKQGYEYLKTLPEYEGAIDVLED